MLCQVRLVKLILGYVMLDLARFSTLTRELRVVEMHGLQIRDSEKFSYPVGHSCFGVKIIT